MTQTTILGRIWDAITNLQKTGLFAYNAKSGEPGTFWKNPKTHLITQIPDTPWGNLN